MAKKNKPEKPTQSLINALTFVKQLYSKKDNPFCSISNNFIEIQNEKMNIGFPVVEDILCFPHVDKMLKALKQINDDVFVITHFENSLEILSNEYRFIVNGTDYIEPMFSLNEPEPRAQINDNLKAACAILSQFTEPEHNDPRKCHVMLQAGNAIGTNGHLLVEYYHGCNIPPIGLPKKAAEIIGKSKSSLASFGFSNDQSTFWFEDDSFVISKYPQMTFPNPNDFFQMKDIQPIPPEFFPGLIRLKPFCTDKIVKIQNEKIFAGENSVSIVGIPDMLNFSIDYLLKFKKHFTQWSVNEHSIEFFGNNCRGIVMGIKANEEPEN